jgi:ABC-type branched-subunit amino acid transport system ATPase component/branched-subunit amino acid ABC-type transport system permease component
VNRFLELLIEGMISGGVISLVASSLVMTYSTSGIFNFGYGGIAFTCSFAFYQLNTGAGLNAPLAGVIVFLGIAPILGLLFEAFVFRRLVDASDATKIVATVGLALSLPALALWSVSLINAHTSLALPPGDNVTTSPGLGPAPAKTWTLARGVILDSDQLIILIAAVLAALALWLVVRHTRAGLNMRAAVDRGHLAQLRGADIRRSSRLSWTLGTMLAALAGIVASPLFSLTTTDYTNLFFQAAVACVIGRFRSIPMAAIGGILVGVGQNLATGYGGPLTNVVGFPTAVPFILMLIGLVFLARDRRRIAGFTLTWAQGQDFSRIRLTWPQRLPWAALVIGLTGYLLFSHNYFWLSLLTVSLAYSLIFASFLMGFLMSHGVPFFAAALIGIAASALAGALVAAPALLLGGLPLALSTLALGLICEAMLFSWNPFANFRDGWAIVGPSVGPIDFSSQRVLGITSLILIGLVTIGLRNLRNSPSGIAMAAVRASEAGAASLGISKVRAKLAVFVLSAAIAALGGIVLSTSVGSITNTNYPTQDGLLWLAAVVVFGIRRPGGALLAGLFFGLGPQVISFASGSAYVPAILFGGAAVQLARTPDGLLGSIRVGVSGWEKALGLLRSRGQRQTAAAQTAPVVTAVTPAASTSVAASSAGLRVSRLTVGYGDLIVLHDIDLVVEPGEIHAVVGLNGAGKSTLCLAVGGLLSVASGSLVLNGETITSMPANRRARHGLFMVPETRGIFPGLSVLENLKIALPDESDRAEVYRRFPMLAARQKIHAQSLSGGEQQILSLAPLAIRTPSVVVVDEPGLGLAPMVFAEVLRILEQIRESGAAVLLVEEKINRILNAADRVTRLDMGRIVPDGETLLPDIAIGERR